MPDAQLLTAKDTSYTVYGPWFRRAGDSVTCTLETIEQHGINVTVSLFTKVAETSGRGVNVDGAVSITGAGPGRVSAT